MARPQELARRQQQIEELCSAAIRALTGDAHLHFRSNRLYQDERPLPVNAPHLRLHPETDDFRAFRAFADGASLRIRYSCPDLHRRHLPEEPVERLIFELLEQLRAESLVPASLPGVRENLHRRFDAWSETYHKARLTETGLGILLYTVAQVCWARLTGNPVWEPTEGMLEHTRAALAPIIGAHLARLARTRHHQAEFAPHALAIARAVSNMIRNAVAEEGDDETNEAEDSAALAAFSLLLDFDNGDSDTLTVAASGHSKTVEASPGYRVFSRRHDREVNAADLVRKALLRDYRQQLDEWVGHQGINVRRLTRLLMAVLAVEDRDGRTFGEEQGNIDGRRLAQLISSPAERRLFWLDRYQPTSDCMVSLLVDCSGSMKEYANALAGIADILVRALEQAKVTTEVLGFTTGAWGGGRPRAEWMGRGRPKYPGRLNETCHMVFKDAGRNWRRARHDLAAFLKLDIYREGVDGEAIEWACSRMLAHGARRRILIVISDGCPTDGATGLANDEFYLGNHLREVVDRHTAQGDVEILGLGVGLDLSPYYQRCLATDLGQGLDNRLFFEIVQLIAGRHRR